MASKTKVAKHKLAKVEKVTSIYKKSQLVASLAECSCVTKKQVKLILDQLASIIGGHLKKGGPGKFVLPNMLKVVIRDVPARKARKGVNPFTGEETIFKAKPASKKVKILPLKQLKDMATK